MPYTLLLAAAPQQDDVLGLGPVAERALLAAAEHRPVLGRPGLEPELVGERAAEVVERVDRAAARDRVAEHQGSDAVGGERAGDRIERGGERGAPGRARGRGGLEAGGRAESA